MRWPCYNCFVDNRCPNPQPKNLLCGGQEGSVGGVQFEQKVSTNTLWHLFAYYILRTLKFQVPTAQASIFGVLQTSQVLQNDQILVLGERFFIQKAWTCKTHQSRKGYKDFGQHGQKMTFQN